MPAAAPTAEPVDSAPRTFLLGLAGRALLYAELCAAPGQPPPMIVERGLGRWARRRRWVSQAHWTRLFWRGLVRGLNAPDRPPPAPAAAGLSGALHGLALPLRQAFLLRVWLGFELNAIADVLGCPPTQAGTLLYQALQQLRAQLGVAPGDDRWLLHGRAALELRASTLAMTQQASLARQIDAALASPPRWPLWAMLTLGALALLFGQPTQPPIQPPANPQILPGERELGQTAAVPAGPVEHLLSLPPEDLALLLDSPSFELLAELEFHLWRLQARDDAH